MCSDRFSNRSPWPKAWSKGLPPTREIRSTPKPQDPSQHSGLVNDPEIEAVLKQLQQTRNKKGIQQLSAALVRLARNYREFSLKLGKKSGVFVVEISVPPFGSAASSSRSLDYAIIDAEHMMRKRIDPQGVLTALDERDLDSAVSDLENIGDDDTF